MVSSLNESPATISSNSMFDIKAEQLHRRITPLVWKQIIDLFPGIPKECPHYFFQVWDYAEARGLDLFSGHVFADVCDQYGHPELRIMTTIEGYRSIAHASGEFGGMDEPEFGPEVSATYYSGETVSGPQWVKVTVYRVTDGMRYPVTAIEWLVENLPQFPYGVCPPIWKRRPAGQLSIRSESQAFRKAFSKCDAQPTYLSEAITAPTNDDISKEEKKMYGDKYLKEVLEKYKSAETNGQISEASAEVDNKISYFNDDQVTEIIHAYEEAVHRVKVSMES